MPVPGGELSGPIDPHTSRRGLASKSLHIDTVPPLSAISQLSTRFYTNARHCLSARDPTLSSRGFSGKAEIRNGHGMLVMFDVTNP